MEKLLHERLRDIEESDVCTPEKLGYGENCGNTYCNKCEVDMFNALADEIERYYIPRPRFEDGEPVQFGDEVQSSNGIVSKVEKLIYYDNGTVTACANMGGGGNCRMDEPFKRPAPKVYDADGVEIKVGDTVYRIDDDWFGHVQSFEFDDKGEPMVLCDSMKSLAKYLTHERPVFDAEGVRICKGNTVWTTVLQDRFTVASLNGADGTVECVDYGGKSWEILPSDLTHRELDSLIKLRNDMKRNNIDPVPMEVNAWVDRLTALIERGA